MAYVMAGSLAELVNLTVMRLPFAKAPLPVDVALVVDDARVSDHHALLPTLAVRDLDWDTLPTAERNILTLLIVRLACAVGEAHSFEAVTAVLECGSHTFTARGKTVLHDGWKELDAAFHSWLKKGGVDTEKDEREEAGSLPQLCEGQVFSSVEISVREGKTSPPHRFTEDTLLAAMESASADEMPEEAERKGLGTPATRAVVIEKLIRSGAVERKKKLLVPTEKGANLIAVLPEELSSPLLTAEWEHRLLEVEHGQMTPDAFMDGIAALTKGLVAANTAPLPAFASLFAQAPKGAIVGKCPRCRADVVEAGKGGSRAQGFFCSSRACRFALWKDSRFWSAKGKKLDKKVVSALLSEGRVSFTDLKSEKTGKTYAATVLLEDDGQRAGYKLEFENNTKARKTA